jgi:hypothetical protein
MRRDFPIERIRPQARNSQVEFEVFNVGEFDFQAVGAAAAVAEVDLAERFGGEGAQLLFAGAGVLGVEEAGRVLRGQGEGEMADAGVVGGAGRGGESEPGAGVDDQAGAGGGLAAGAFADAGLLALAHRGLQSLGEVDAGL